MAVEETVDVGEQEGPDGERERSTIPFPYADADNAIRIAKGVHQVGGSTCELAQLAAQLDLTIRGGGFRQMLAAAKVFGLVTFTKGTVQLTVLGQRINDPKQEKAAKAEAFLTVPLYRAIYERVKGAGGTLPPAAGLENEMVSLGVARTVVDRARQTFQRSALQAGFFAFGQDRLILPAVGPVDGTKGDGSNLEGRPPGGNGGEGGGGGRPRLIEGLIETLPQAGTEWSLEDRHRWLQLAAGIFEFVYRSKDASGGRRTLRIEIESAKENAR